MAEEGKEQGQGEKIRVASIDYNANVFDDNSIIYRGICLSGFPIRFGEPEPDEGDPCIDIYTDTNEHRVDMQNIKYLIGVSGVGSFIKTVSWGNPHKFAKLLTGREEEFYDWTPLHATRGMNPGGRYDASPELLKRLYLTAYDRYQQLVAEGKRPLGLLNPEVGYTEFTSTPDETDAALYQRILAEGLKPIVPDELIQLAKEEAQKIRAQGVDKVMSAMAMARLSAISNQDQERDSSEPKEIH